MVAKLQFALESLKDPKLCMDFYEFVYRIAIRSGMDVAEAEDCSTAFVEHMLTHPLHSQNDIKSPQAWLHRCIGNWIIDWRRNARKRQKHHLQLEGNHQRIEYAATTSHPHIEASILQRELHIRVEAAIEQLTQDQQQLFRSYVYEGKSVEELAKTNQRSNGAIRQSLTSIRKQLRKILERHDLNESNARDYLQLITTKKTKSKLPFVPNVPRGAKKIS